jgi:hypothetical protein
MTVRKKTTTVKTEEKKVARKPHLKTIKLGDVCISPRAQRDVATAQLKSLVSNFNPDLMGIPVVSYRDGSYWVVDGQHRVLALKQVLGSDADEWDFVAECYEGLDEAAEASLFLNLNSRKPVNAFDRFKVGVVAQLPVPADINRIVMSLGLRVSLDRQDGCIGAVSALEKVYAKGGPTLLVKTLSTVRDAWDSTVWDSFVVIGVGQFIQRYDKRLISGRLVKRLGAVPMGSKGLRAKANKIRDGFGTDMADSTAAAITDEYNKGLRGAKSLGSWFKEDK